MNQASVTAKCNLGKPFKIKGFSVFLLLAVTLVTLVSLYSCICVSGDVNPLAPLFINLLKSFLKI